MNWQEAVTALRDSKKVEVEDGEFQTEVALLHVRAANHTIVYKESGNPLSGDIDGVPREFRLIEEEAGKAVRHEVKKSGGILRASGIILHAWISHSKLIGFEYEGRTDLSHFQRAPQNITAKALALGLAREDWTAATPVAVWVWEVK